MKTMLKCWIILLTIMQATPVFAQPDLMEEDDSRKEKIEALKRAFISDKLQLSVSEAEKFWPLYNEFNTKRQEVRKAMRTSAKKLKEGSKTEKDLLENLDAIGARRKEEVDLENKLVRDCLPILGVAKCSKLAGIEREFQKELMDNLRDRKHEGPPPPHGGRPEHRRN